MDGDPTANLAVVRRIYEELLSQGRREVALELIDPAVIDHRAFPGEPTGFENILAGAGLLRAAFPSPVFTVEHLAAAGDLVFAHWQMTGVHRGPYQGHAPCGRPLEWRGITCFRFAGGRVVERWLYADDGGLIRQIESEQAPFLLFVNGTLMRGLALHRNLDGAEFVRAARTAPRYRLYSIEDRHPGMVEAPEGAGVAVTGELYRLPAAVWERVEAGEPPNLYRGLVTLERGEETYGILYRPEALQPHHRDISAHGGWSEYRANATPT